MSATYKFRVPAESIKKVFDKSILVQSPEDEEWAFFIPLKCCTPSSTDYDVHVYDGFTFHFSKRGKDSNGKWKNLAERDVSAEEVCDMFDGTCEEEPFEEDD